MKIKNFKIFEREGFDDIDDAYDDYNQLRNSFDKNEFNDDDDDLDIEELSSDDMVESLMSTIRKMLKNANFSKYYVFQDKEEGGVNVQFILKHSEKMTSIMKIMNFLKKLDDEIFQGYECEFELWETKTFDPLITAKFYRSDDEEEGEEMYDDTELPF